MLLELGRGELTGIGESIRYRKWGEKNLLELGRGKIRERWER